MLALDEFPPLADAVLAVLPILLLGFSVESFLPLGVVVGLNVFAVARLPALCGWMSLFARSAAELHPISMALSLKTDKNENNYKCFSV